MPKAEALHCKSVAAMWKTRGKNGITATALTVDYSHFNSSSLNLIFNSTLQHLKKKKTILFFPLFFSFLASSLLTPPSFLLAGCFFKCSLCESSTPHNMTFPLLSFPFLPCSVLSFLPSFPCLLSANRSFLPAGCVFFFLLLRVCVPF